MLLQRTFSLTLGKTARCHNLSLLRPLGKSNCQNFSTLSAYRLAKPLRNNSTLSPFHQKIKTNGPLIPTVYHQKHWTSTVTVKQDEEPKEPARVLYNNWLDRLPAKLAPYAFLTRIDKPVGTWLLFWPCGKIKTIFNVLFCTHALLFSLEHFNGSLSYWQLHHGRCIHDYLIWYWRLNNERCGLHNQ